MFNRSELLHLIRDEGGGARGLRKRCFLKRKGKEEQNRTTCRNYHLIEKIMVKKEKRGRIEEESGEKGHLYREKENLICGWMDAAFGGHRVWKVGWHG